MRGINRFVSLQLKIRRIGMGKVKRRIPLIPRIQISRRIYPRNKTEQVAAMAEKAELSKKDSEKKL